MYVTRPYQRQDGQFHGDNRSFNGRRNNMGLRATTTASNYNVNYNTNPYNTFDTINRDFTWSYPQNFVPNGSNYDQSWCDGVPLTKRRKLLVSSSDSHGKPYQPQVMYKNGLESNLSWKIVPSRSNSQRDDNSARSYLAALDTSTRPNDSNSNSSTILKRSRSMFEGDEEVIFATKDEIENASPSRKDGIDALHETRLRYSYCAFLQDLGIGLDLPQTTIGTAMVLCHRFFFRRSHVSHDRYLIATAALFLASKSEESQRALNDVLRISCEILHNQQFSLLSYTLPTDWFEQYRERIIEAEQLILTTLNFELNVHHPYESLTSTLEKLGFSQSALVNLALSLVSEGSYRGLACSPYDINSWAVDVLFNQMLCFSSEVELEISCGCFSIPTSLMTCSLEYRCIMDDHNN